VEIGDRAAQFPDTCNDKTILWSAAVDIDEQLIELFHETEEACQEAGKEANGESIDWPIWYADYLLDNGIEDLLEAKLVKSDLIYLLVRAAHEQAVEAPGSKWDRYYAEFFLSRYVP
jgi:hypothetical protein